jgi:cell division protein FtsN
MTHKVKNAFSTSDIIKVKTEFKHDLAAEPSTPILPPEVRPQTIETPKPVVAYTPKPKPKPLATSVAKAANPPLKKGMYRVVAGAYTTRKEADDVLVNIKADGFPSYIYSADNKYRIQIGAFKTKAAAEELRKKALEYGYNAFVSIY